MFTGTGFTAGGLAIDPGITINAVVGLGSTYFLPTKSFSLAVAIRAKQT